MEKGKSLPVVRWDFVAQLRHNEWGFFSASYLFVERSSRNEGATNVQWNSAFSDAKKRNFLDIKVRARQKTLILHFLGILGARAWLLEEWVSMDWSLEEIFGFKSWFFFSIFLSLSLVLWLCYHMYIFIWISWTCGAKALILGLFGTLVWINS